MLRSIVAGAAIAGSAAVAAATPLNLTQGRPDAFSAFISITYDASSHLLSADGFTQNFQLDYVSPSVSLNNRVWHLTAEILNDGSFTGAGSLSIFGDYGGTNVLLDSAVSIDQFGSSPGKLEFIFSGVGSGGSINTGHVPTGVILSDDTLSFAGFALSFDNLATADGRSDSFLIPAPGAAALGACCLALAAGRRRR
ncbi:MAG TPA: hypothetical protein VHC70_08370 [Phycisphaerales bacterium]|jgi:hypothetical protein|nr:hypothetical protein [Phycisphaerales bacterium]